MVEKKLRLCARNELAKHKSMMHFPPYVTGTNNIFNENKSKLQIEFTNCATTDALLKFPWSTSTHLFPSRIGSITIPQIK